METLGWDGGRSDLVLDLTAVQTGFWFCAADEPLGWNRSELSKTFPE